MSLESTNQLISGDKLWQLTSCETVTTNVMWNYDNQWVVKNVKHIHVIEYIQYSVLTISFSEIILQQQNSPLAPLCWLTCCVLYPGGQIITTQKHMLLYTTRNTWRFYNRAFTSLNTSNRDMVLCNRSQFFPYQPTIPPVQDHSSSGIRPQLYFKKPFFCITHNV